MKIKRVVVLGLVTPLLIFVLAVGFLASCITSIVVYGVTGKWEFSIGNRV